MASLQRNYSQEKLFGQVYTPSFIVKKILDDIHYTHSKILEKKILDPACGDGRFLIEIVKRIIQFSSKENLEENLAQIYAWDINSEAIALCKENLNFLIKDFDFEMDWNIEQKNSIHLIEKIHKQDFQKFDFIVGNPPYVRIQHLEAKERKYIQEKFKFCKKGSTDIYIAFFELAYEMLNENGLCALITPNTFFYTSTAEELRKFLIREKL